MKHLGLAILAVLATLFGGIIILRPGIAGTLATDYLLVLVLGGAMAVVGLTRAYRSRSRRLETDDLGDPEVIVTYPTPGDDLQRAWDDDRMQVVAVQLLVRSRGCTEAEARSMLENGTWTDDTTAAAYFKASSERGGLVGLGHRLVGLIRRRRRRRRALAVLSAEAGLDGEGDDS